MKTFYTDITEVLGAAAQSLVGGLMMWLLTVTVAGAIPTAIAFGRLDDIGWELSLAWVGHLATAGIAIWGLLIVCIHVACLAALIHGTGTVLRALVAAFIAQLTTSTAVLLLLEADNTAKLVAAWACFGLLATFYFIHSYVRQAREAKRSVIERRRNRFEWTSSDPRPWRPPARRW